MVKVIQASFHAHTAAEAKRFANFNISVALKTNEKHQKMKEIDSQVFIMCSITQLTPVTQL